jgi:hypothetical protein
MKGRRALRRAGIVLGFGALLCAGAMASGAFGMALIESGPTTSDSTSTATDPAPPSSTDTAPTSTGTAPTSTETTTTSTGSTTTTATTFTPSIKSDKADYAPGSTVTLTGAGWGPGDSVHIFVNDDVGQSWSYSADVTADVAGGFTHQFDLPGWFVADYSVSATGSAGAAASTTFTDAKTNTVQVAAPNSVTVLQGATAVYGAVTVDINGNSSPCTVTLGTSTESGDTGLPVGVSAIFSNGSFTTTGSDATSSFSLSTTSTGPAAGRTPIGTYTFHVTATDSAGCQNGTNTTVSSARLTLVVGPFVGAVTVGAQTGTLTSGTAGSATYTVTVTRNGGTGTAFSAALSVTTALPTGATASFSPATVSFLAGDTSKTSTLTITTTTATPSGTAAFTVRAANPALTGDASTGNGTLTVGAGCTAPSVTTNPTNQSITYGSNASFTAAASGNPAPTAQWQVS